MKWGSRIIEIRWINSDVLRLDGVDGLLVKKKKKVRMVKNELIAKNQMMVAAHQVKLV